MNQQLVHHEHQVAGSGWNKGEKRWLLRGKFGEILKPVKLISNKTYCKGRALKILQNSCHNHQLNDEWNNDSTKNITDISIVNENGFIEKKSHKSNISIDTSRNGSNDSNSDEDMVAASLGELDFYTSLQSCQEQVCNTLKNLMPQFLGNNTFYVNEKEVLHLVLKDLTCGMQYPCVADIKMGRTSYCPGRIKKTGQREQVQEEIGFRLPGMKVFHPTTGNVIKHFGPDVGKYFNKEQVYDALGTLVQMGVSQRSNELTTAVLRGLNEIHKWFKIQRIFKLRSSSILITYDAKQLDGDHHTVPSNGDLPANGVDSSESPTDVCVTVKLIDFAHVFLVEGQPDHSYIFGLENLIQIFNNILYKL